MKLYYFGILLIIVLLMNCKRSPTDQYDPVQVQYDSLEMKVDHFFEDYYNWEYDSAQIMSFLDQLADENQQQSQGDNLTTALLLHYKGRVLYEENHELQAIRFYEKALAIRKKLLPPSHEDIAKGNQNLSMSHLWLSQYYKALEYSLQAAKYPNHLSPEIKVTVYQNLARIYNDIGDLDQAQNYLNNALSFAEHQKSNSTGEQKQVWERKWGVFCSDMAFLLANGLNDPTAALPYAKKSSEVFSRLLSDSRDSSELATCYHHFGIIYESIDSFELAILNFNQSLSINHALEGRAKHIGANLNNIGIVYKKTGQYKKAKTYSFQALKYDNKNKDLLKMSYTYDNLGDVYLGAKNLDSALIYYNRAVQNVIADFHTDSPIAFPDIDPTKITDKTGLYIYLSSKANVLHKKYSESNQQKWLFAAFTNYLKLDTLADIMRLEFRSDASKESLVEKTKPVYEKAIDLCMLLHQVTGKEQYQQQAFNFSEKSKSLILLEAIRRTGAKTILNENLAETERTLHLKKTFYEKKYALAQINQQNNSVAQHLLDSLSKYSTKYDQKIIEITRQYPNFKVLKDNVQTASISFIRDTLLKPDETLIEYFTGENSIYCFVIAPSFFKSLKIPIDSALIKTIQEFNQGILKKKTKGFANPAFELYSKIFLPIKKECPLSKKLIIIPDGFLSYISFDALLSSQVKPEDMQYFKAFPWLMNKHTISYNYSATLWDEMNTLKGGKTAPISFAGFAPSFPKGTSIKSSHNNYSMGPLKLNLEEVKHIKKSLGGDIYNKRKATIANFQKYAHRYRMLHLSTHGQANNKSGDYSFIVFSGKKSGTYDFLYVKDLYTLELNAELVVLSACETNTGELQTGEGVISLARGFAYAGAQSILTTLWVANEEASMDITSHFYTYLNQQQDKATSLRLAKFDYINKQKLHRKAHPYYWASFLPIGNMKAIIQK